MVKIHLLFCATIVMSVYGYQHNSTSFKRPCRNLSPECVKYSLQLAMPFLANGSPELGLESLDPYVVKELNFTLPGITIRFNDGYVVGLRTCIVDFARFVGDTLESQVHCNLTIKGRYKSSGRLLMFPIDGDGISTIKCENLKIHTVMKLGVKVRSGVKYLEVKSYAVKHAYDGKVNYFMTNLFKNNPEMSKVLLEFMNNSWRMVAEEFGTPLVDYGMNAFIRNVRHFLEVLPLNELKRL